MRRPLGSMVTMEMCFPIKRLSILRLELHNCLPSCFAMLSVNSVFAWTDCTIVLTWLPGSATHADSRPTWRIVAGTKNPADCGIFPLQLKSGRKVPNGIDLTLSCAHYLRPFLRKNDRSIIWQPIIPTTRFGNLRE